MPDSIEIYSSKQKALVSFTVSKETEKDGGGNEHKFILLKNGDEEHRLSPNTSPKELELYAQELIYDAEGSPLNEGYSI